MKNYYQPKNILVTGGAGFIGSHFIRHILQNFSTVTVVNLDKLTYAGSLDNLKELPNKEQYHFLHGDICDQKLVEKVLSHHCIDTIVHFAAESHVDRSIEGPAAFIQTNINGTFNLLECARQFWLEKNKMGSNECRFHHISTDEVYGTLLKDEPAFCEQTPYMPNSPYSASKAASDHIVRAYYHTYGLPITISNCSNNYGPYQHPEKFIPTVIHSCVNWRSIPVYGDGTNIRDWLYVEDHCEGIVKILLNGKLGESYNIGGNNELNNLELVNLICKCMDNLKPQKTKYESLITFIKDRPGHDWRYAINANKITNQLGWKPQNPFETNLLNTIQWYLRRNPIYNLAD